MNKLRSIDLFAGCGGLMDGFEQSGKYETLAAVEWEKGPCRNLRKRLRDKWKYKNADDMVLQFDIQRTDELFDGWKDDEIYGSSEGLDKLIGSEKLDVIIGGPPCQACERYLGHTISNDYIDTLRLAKKVFPDWKHRRLSDLAEHYGISTEGAHRALADCRMNQKIFEYLGKELAGKQLKVQNNTRICPKCHLPMQRRNGRFGEFWGCTGFPKCRHTENI